MIDATLEQLLGGVTERSVPDVVKQRCRPHQSSVPTPPVGVEQAVAPQRHRIVDPAGELHGSDGMTESAVLGSRKDQIGESQLPNRAQSLQRAAVDQRSFQRIGIDEPVNRIPKRRDWMNDRRQE